MPSPDTIAIRMLRDWSVYRAGDVLPEVPRGQAAVWFARAMAEPVDTPPAPLRTAEIADDLAGAASDDRRRSERSIKRRG
jgi:hypothetical protein